LKSPSSSITSSNRCHSRRSTSLSGRARSAGASRAHDVAPSHLGNSRQRRIGRWVPCDSRDERTGCVALQLALPESAAELELYDDLPPVRSTEGEIHSSEILGDFPTQHPSPMLREDDFAFAGHLLCSDVSERASRVIVTACRSREHAVEERSRYRGLLTQHGKHPTELALVISETQPA
jgi:hypothetical protein